MRRCSWPCAALVAGVVASLFVYAAGLGPAEAIMTARGHGIVGLELAGSASRFEGILGDWAAVGVEAARSSIRWDFAFIPAYGLLLWALVRGRRWGAPAVVTACLLDVVENVAMWRAIGHVEARDWLVPVATAAAAVKFALLASVVVAILASGAARLRARARRGREGR